VRKPEGKKPFGKIRRGWEDNIEIYFEKKKFGGGRYVLD
jgi:hypothetical protein